MLVQVSEFIAEFFSFFFFLVAPRLVDDGVQTLRWTIHAGQTARRWIAILGQTADVLQIGFAFNVGHTRCCSEEILIDLGCCLSFIYLQNCLEK